MLKRYTKGINGKFYMYLKNEGEYQMGVSMGVIKPITGSAAQKLLKDSSKSSFDEKVLDKCKQFSSMITKR